jgi:arylsulfatase
MKRSRLVMLVLALAACSSTPADRRESAAPEPAKGEAEYVGGRNLGSPAGTVSLGGKQLPPPPPKFEGKIERGTEQSTPWWPPRVVPPRGAPNVLLIMTDDSGYGVPSTFGGVIPTPALDRIAAHGLRYTN